MHESRFWEIIAAAKSAAGSDSEAREDTLRAQLDALDTDELVAFDATFSVLHRQAYRWDLWGAAYVMHGGCGDDSFIDFRNWLISEGEQVYRAALRDPDSLADLPQVEDCTLEGIGYVAGTLLEQRHAETARPQGAPASPAGDEWDEDDLAELFPRLSALYD